MFVRWKIRVPWRAWYKDFPWRNPGMSFSAVLVRSERVNGKPRQKIVAYLGHIKEKNLDSKAQRLYFWESVDRPLDALVLSPAERQQIEEEILQRVDRPAREVVEREKQETLDKLRALFGRA
jgi:hypothetical protein